VPKQKTAYLRKRQYAFDAAACFRVEEAGAMPEGLFDYRFPTGAVKKSGFAAVCHKLIPARKVALL
jgi:hypothetical protein